MRLCEGLDNSTTTLLTRLDIEAAAWKLGGAENVTEAKSFYLQLDDGSTLIYQIAFTNVAWPTDWFQVNAHYLPAGLSSLDDKGSIEHSDNVSRFWAKLSKDKLSVEASSGSININTEQDIRLKLKCGKLRFDLVIEESIGLITLGDGCIYIPEEGHIHMSFLPSLKGEGTIRIKDGKDQSVRVRGMAVIQWQGVKVHRCASKWTLGWYLSENSQIITMQMQGSKKQEYHKVSLNIVAQNGVILLATIDCHMEANSASLDRKVGMKLLGQDSDGKEVILEARVDELSQLTRIKVLDNVPFLVRKVLQAFMPNPTVSHYKSSSAKILRDGQVVTEGVFLLEESIIHKPDQ
jgi:hypothetical protein